MTWIVKNDWSQKIEHRFTWICSEMELPQTTFMFHDVLIGKPSILERIPQDFPITFLGVHSCASQPLTAMLENSSIGRYSIGVPRQWIQMG